MTTFDELSKEQFQQTIEERRAHIDAASAAPLPGTHPLNEFAKRLHPDRQYMKVDKVTEIDAGTKLFRLVPDPARGTAECAPFIAGQYVNIYLDIEGMQVNRSYSIASSPKDARDGFYELLVKYVEGGLVSRYVLDNWAEGDEVELSGPAGAFYYSTIRDAKTVVCLAGGSGITPFRSLAKAIVEGDEDFELVLLFGSRTEELILFREEFDALAADDRISVVHVLSDEEREGYENGFITAELITKYAPADAPYSVFVCGPQAMYRFVDNEIEKLGLERKFVRHELFGEVHNPAEMDDYPGGAPDAVKITVSIRDETRTIDGSANDSILQTLEKAGITVPASCRSGECGFCHSTLVSGNVYVPKAVDGRRMADLKFGGIHPCVTFPLSDLEIIVPAAK